MGTESSRQIPALPPAGPDPLTPAQRSKLQRFFGFGQQKSKQGDHAYAHQMFEQCVAGDPSNLVYLEAMLENLRARDENNKRKGRVRSNRGDFKKAVAEKRWSDALAEGVKLLGEHPWDIPTLRGMAEACAGLHYNEVELRYLKMALDANPRDADVNRHCAISLTRMGQYDQAIACWHRLEEILPGKGEAPQKISELTLLKNRIAAGYIEDPALANSASGSSKVSNPGVPARPVSPAGAGKPVATTAKAEPTEEKPLTLVEQLEQLEKGIQKKPSDTKLYLAMADVYRRLDRIADEERTLRRALQVSGNDLAVRERIEEVQIRRAKLDVDLAEQRQTAEPSSEHEQVVQQKRTQLNRLELAIFQARSERYPHDRTLSYEWAIRLKRAGNYEQAAPRFDVAAAEPRLAANARIQEGECLQQLRQYQQALRKYVEAAKAAEEAGQVESLKLAHYRAGVLASGLKNWEFARKSLAAVVALETGYRDAQSRLDNLPAM